LHSSAILGKRALQEIEDMRVAIVHDWLYVVGGAERVLAEMIKCFPQADIFTLFDFLKPEDRASIGIAATKTSFLQKMPGVRRRHTNFLPLMPYAIEQFDFSGYDLVISSSYAVAKGIITGPDQVHVSYVHSPMRYAWDLQGSYMARSNFGKLKQIAARFLLHYMRIWDARTGHGPDVMLANSGFVGRRIRKIYGREASVLYPPVDLPKTRIHSVRGDYFLAASRLVPYKNIEQIVRAFALIPDLKLVVAGDGPELAKLKAIATANVSFTGFIETPKLRQLMASARAFVFAAEEDFGIIPVEAQSEGTPVIAYGRGGCLETVAPGRTGLFFYEQTPEAISQAVKSFLKQEKSFSPDTCRSQAMKFSAERFRQQFLAVVNHALAQRRKETEQPSSSEEGLLYAPRAPHR
jgi:glycosyltransferase involved in cell wall biosynthesis